MTAIALVQWLTLTVRCNYCGVPFSQVKGYRRTFEYCPAHREVKHRAAVHRRLVKAMRNLQ